MMMATSSAASTYASLNHKSIQNFSASPIQPSPSSSISYSKNPKTIICAIQSHKWNLVQKLVATTLDKLENIITSEEQKHPLPKTRDPNVQISGNYSPVPEQPVTHNFKVIGKIPEHIQGVYLRNGPNPLFKPTSGHHLFDGDGMISVVKFENGSVSYASRFTQTQRLVQEREIGKPVFPKPIGELHGHIGIARLMLFCVRGLCGLINFSRGIGVANAGLVYFNNRILALSEEDLPYHVRVTANGDLETVSRYNFNGQLKCSMIAHPKVDPVTGELFALSYDILRKPYLKYFRFSPDGTKSKDVEIDLKKPTMVHDFAITENFVVVPDQQLVFELCKMITGGSPVGYDKEKVSRFGVLRKYDSNGSGINWIKVPNCFCFHLWNAWEEHESDEVVVIGSRMTPPDSVFNECNQELKSVLSEIRLNLKTGESSRRAIVSPENDVNLEAGMVNKKLLGRKSKYVYLAIAEPWPKVSGFAKVDLFTGEIIKFIFGDSKFGGEPMFIAKSNKYEDDGHILVFVHDEKTLKSELQIVHSRTMVLEAKVMLPARVPYGFHGTFVSTDDLAAQA